VGDIPRRFGRSQIAKLSLLLACVIELFVMESLMFINESLRGNGFFIIVTVSPGHM
jgi:hypothetical protein